MTETLAPQFSKPASPENGGGGKAAPDPYRTPFKPRVVDLDDYQEQMIKLLDSGVADGDAIIDSMLWLDQRFFERVDPMIKARMMGVLSADIAAHRADPKLSQDTSHIDTMLDAGRYLARCTQLPENIVAKFRNPANAVLTEFTGQYRGGMAQEKIAMLDRVVEIFQDIKGAPTKRQLRDLKLAISENELKILSEDFNKLITRHFELKRPIRMEFFSAAKPDEHGNVTRGLATWDPAENQAVTKMNTAFVKTVADLPHYLMTQAHEGVHCLITQQHKLLGGRSIESLRKDHPEYYLLMQLTDRTFYSSQEKAIYTWHPEEVLAQRVGLLVGISVAGLFGMMPTRKDFIARAKQFEAPQVENELYERLPEKRRRDRAKDAVIRAAQKVGIKKGPA